MTETDPLPIPSAYKEAFERDFSRFNDIVDGNLQTVEWRGQRVPLFNQVEISPIDMCNRSCVFCPRSDPEVAPNQTLAMSLDLCRKMAAEMLALNFKGTVSLAGYGEPLMHRQLAEIVQIFSPLINVEIYTNGDLLNAKRVTALVAAGASRIVVNLYDNPEQRSHFEALFHAAKVAQSFYVIRDRWLSAEQSFGMKVTNRAGTVAFGGGQSGGQSRPCYYTHYLLMVDWNGDVFLCAQDWNRRVKAGNLFASSMMEVWTGSLLKRYRRHLAAGRRDLSPCNKCNADGDCFGLRHAQAWAAVYGD